MHFLEEKAPVFWKKCIFFAEFNAGSPLVECRNFLEVFAFRFRSGIPTSLPVRKTENPSAFWAKNHFPRKISAAVLPRRYLFSIKNNTLHERCGNADSPCANSYTGTRCVITLHKRRGKPQTRCKRPHTNKSRHANRVDPLSPRPLLRAERRCARLPARRLSLPKGLPFS